MSDIAKVMWAMLLGIVFAIFAVGFLSGFFAHSAIAQDYRGISGNHGDGHAQHHDWYRALRTKHGWSCCNGDEVTAHGTTPGDCRPVKARPIDDERWEAWFNGTWNEIPKEAVLPDELNKVPTTAHICERAGYIYCFLKSGAGI